MLLTVAEDPETQTRILVVGLDTDDMFAIANDAPITTKLGGALDGWELTVFGPEDTFRYMMQRKDLNLT